MKSFLKIILVFAILIIAPNCSNDADEVATSLPKITTKAVSNITFSSIGCGAQIISDGGSPITAKGLVYGTSNNPTLNDFVVSAGSGMGNFDLTITNLTPTTTYFIRAFATNSSGTVYGSQVTVITVSSNVPLVTTGAVSEINNTSAVIAGEVVTAYSTVLTKGIVYSTNPNPTIADNLLDSTAAPEIISALLTGLSRNTTYYARAFATNANGTGYGAEISFTTSNRDLMLSTSSHISGHVLNNKQDKLLYLVTYDYSPGPTYSNLKLIAYDYTNKVITRQMPLNNFSAGSQTSLGLHNGQMELYLGTTNGVLILDSVTLQTISSIPMSNVIIGSVEQKNGFVFVSYLDAARLPKLAVYSRSSLTLLNQIPAFEVGAMTLYNDLSNPTQIDCLIFSSTRGFTSFSCDSSGMLSFTAAGGYQDSGSIRTRDDVDFVVQGRRGNVFFKNNLTSNSISLSTEYNLSDFAITNDGMYIYALRQNLASIYSILKFNTSNFTLSSTIPILERTPDQIFIDNNNILILDLLDNGTLRNLYLTIY